jgi:hypothetical protein
VGFAGALALALSPAGPVGGEQPAAAADCSWNPAIHLEPETPRLEWPRVWMTGRIYQSPKHYCLVRQSWVYAQTKACGVFGCNWETRSATGSLPNRTSWAETPGMDCRSGTHRYRTRVLFAWGYYGGDGIYGASRGEESRLQPEFTCK